MQGKLQTFNYKAILSRLRETFEPLLRLTPRLSNARVQSRCQVAVLFAASLAFAIRFLINSIFKWFAYTSREMATWRVQQQFCCIQLVILLLFRIRVFNRRTWTKREANSFSMAANSFALCSDKNRWVLSNGELFCVIFGSLWIFCGFLESRRWPIACYASVKLTLAQQFSFKFPRMKSILFCYTFRIRKLIAMLLCVIDGKQGRRLLFR